MKQSMALLIASVVVGLLLTGCSRNQEGTQDEQVVVAASIRTDCIVHYYKTDGSAYITQQQHGYNPSEGFFEACSTEPGGVIQCTLFKEDYTSSGLKEHRLSDLPKSFGSKNLVIALFYSFCAGGDLLETESMTSAANVKIEGRWYEPLKPEWPSEINLTLLRAVDTERIELVRLEDKQAGLTWLFKSYNTRYSKELSKRIPRTIDVFDIRDGVASKELMIRFDYKDIQKVGKQASPN
jgi:hypothetical protein